MIEFIIENKEWIFSGVGVAIIGGVLGMLFLKRKNEQNISAGHSSTNIQTGNGSKISISTSKDKDELIQRASFEDVKKYDHKTSKLIRTIEKDPLIYFRRNCSLPVIVMLIISLIFLLRSFFGILGKVAEWLKSLF
ncbi:MAG: hypothetical protein HY879_21470 [Deltaproteobacteria bacterium]|nr:hypothetical protein [Deltaproteobacteria bacterium]